MLTFSVCAGCSCYVRRSDALCPFCGRAVAHAVVTSTPRKFASGLSRGQLFAFGTTLALVGCGGTEAGAKPDATTEAALPTNMFECRGSYEDGGTSCDRRTQYCWNSGNFASFPASCQPLGGVAVMCDASDCSCTAPKLDAGAQCTGIAKIWYCGCSVDAGDVTVVCGCTGCYGAPPPRPERVA